MDIVESKKEFQRKWKAPTPEKAKVIFEACKWYSVTIFAGMGVFSTHDYGIPTIVFWFIGLSIIPVAVIGLYAKTREVIQKD